MSILMMSSVHDALSTLLVAACTATWPCAHTPTYTAMSRAFTGSLHAQPPTACRPMCKPHPLGARVLVPAERKLRA